ncbi:hypothetical protein D9M71_646010 [compost metagenome]
MEGTPIFPKTVWSIVLGAWESDKSIDNSSHETPLLKISCLNSPIHLRSACQCVKKTLTPSLANLLQIAVPIS